MIHLSRTFSIAAITLAATVCLAAEPPQITVSADKPGAKINPAMWGIFFEDINLGADGGLYAELVKNRSFEFPDAMMGWRPITNPPTAATPSPAHIQIREELPFDPANPHYLRIRSGGSPAVGVANEGFRGMGVRAGDRYDFSMQVRAAQGNPALRIEITDDQGKVLATGRISDLTPQWQKRSATLVAGATQPKAQLRLWQEGAGAVDLDMVSLFPQKTWKNRPGGLRADMVQWLADLKPGFMRFPGGCIVEGRDLPTRYQWKTTIGPVEDRKLIVNRWNTEFRHRLTPDYFQSFGLGFFEFFQLCDDIGAEPLPILNCGMACQFNTSQLVPLGELDPYIQDALDLIEFANGPVDSTWGAKRAAMGHQEPFRMKMMGVGNEQWGPQYLERYVAFAKVLKEKHPEIMLISDAGPSPADDRFQFLWPKLVELKADIVDQHCYANPIWFLANAHRYDNYDRNGPKIFMGEYAAQSVAIVSPDNKNNLECALAEAAYMTGLERNADVVRMASYAPLFAHIEGWQWTPNLIWTDNLRSYGTPNYYAQQLFSRNRGDVMLPVEVTGVDLPSAPNGRVGVGTYQTAAEFKDVRVTRGGDTLLASEFSGDTRGWSSQHGTWSVKNGAYQQADPNGTGMATAGDAAWSDYTVSLKARKLAGSEGFMVLVRADGPENYIACNFGGFRNQAHTIQFHLAQQDHLIAQTPGSVETGRWYDVKIELKGAQLSCSLDGQLVQTAEVPPVQTQRLYASAVRDEKAGEVILKVVNPGSTANEAQIRLAGLANVATGARAIVLTSAALSDVNSLDNPGRVVPMESKVAVTGPEFKHSFPPRSFTVLRLGSKTGN